MTLLLSNSGVELSGNVRADARLSGSPVWNPLASVAPS